MPPILLILLKINGVLLLFTLTYYLILRRLTFYKLNRFFLLTGIVFSSIFPFIDLTDFVYKNAGNSELIKYLPTTQTNELPNLNYVWQIVTSCLILGMLILAIRFGVQLFSLYRIYKNSEATKIGEENVRVMREKIHPFTFWQTIFINPTLHQPEEFSMIVAHEKVHVKQWHTIDILLAQVGVVFYWFNPGIWFMKIFIRENLEFITDEAILKKGVERKSYQYNLLKVETGIRYFEPVNSFNLNGVKKRIQMMNAQKSGKFKLISYFIFLPLLILFSLIFTISKKELPFKQELVAIGEALQISNPKIAAAVNQEAPLIIDAVNLKEKKEKKKVVSSQKDNAENIVINVAEPIKTKGIDIQSTNNHSFHKLNELSASSIVPEFQTKRRIRIAGVSLINSERDANQPTIIIKGVATSQKSGFGKILLDGVELKDENLLSKVDPQDIKTITVKGYGLNNKDVELHIQSKIQESATNGN